MLPTGIQKELDEVVVGLKLDGPGWLSWAEQCPEVFVDLEEGFSLDDPSGPPFAGINGALRAVWKMVSKQAINQAASATPGTQAGPAVEQSHTMQLSPDSHRVLKWEFSGPVTTEVTIRLVDATV